MDRLPFPNHPGVIPKTDVTRAEAHRLCKQIGKRLCTEAEWERACKGENNDVFPTGHSWDQTCAASTRTCTNGFGLLSLGTQVAEWTSSDLARPKDDKTLAIVRGGPASAPTSTHRCAHRRGVPPDLHSETIGFRCCTGTPQSLEIAPILAKPLVQAVDLDAAKLQKIFDSIPRLSRLGKIRLFDPKQIDIVLSKGKAERGGNALTTSPLLWSPVAGEQILVVAGIGSVGSAFVVALYALPANRYKLASSFIFKDQPGPVVLAHNGWTKRRIRWSSCWDCVGEEGAIIYRKGGRIVIEQR